MFCCWKLALSNSVIVLPVLVVISVEINWKFFFRSGHCIKTIIISHIRNSDRYLHVQSISQLLKQNSGLSDLPYWLNSLSLFRLFLENSYHFDIFNKIYRNHAINDTAEDFLCVKIKYKTKSFKTVQTRYWGKSTFNTSKQIRSRLFKQDTEGSSLLTHPNKVFQDCSSKILREVHFQHIQTKSFKIVQARYWGKFTFNTCKQSLSRLFKQNT